MKGERDLAIEAEALSYVYGPGGFALAIDSLRVQAGERVAVAGPSGCGKSTFLELIAGERAPTSGRLRVLDQEMSTLKARERRALRLKQLGIVFQDSPLVDHLSTLENVLLPYHLGAGDLTVDVRRRASSLLARLKIEGAHRPPTSLSQGERQRVAIARALVTEPKLILADEPTSGLDRPRADAICELLLTLSEESGATLVFVTHDATLLPRFERVLDGAAFSKRPPKTRPGGADDA